MRDFSLTPDNYRSYYSWEEFSKLDKSEREQLVRFTVEQIRTERGLENVNVEFFDADSSRRGSCRQDFDGKRFTGHTLKLNSDVLTDKDNYYMPYQTFNTINHELEHASQFELASDRRVKNSDPAALEQRLNDQHYYSASGDKAVVWQGQTGRISRFGDGIDYQMYRAQACEADARAAGLGAVEGLKKDGQQDPYLDSYIKTQKAREINNNRVMMSKLGMHSREEMAKEELQYISTRNLKEPDRQRVLEYARQKDFEAAKEVLRADSRGDVSEEELKNRFDNDQGYSNFYKTQYYDQNKVNESNHDAYVYAKHKWSDAGEEDVNNISESNGVADSVGEKDSIVSMSDVKSTVAGMSATARMNIRYNTIDQNFLTERGYVVTQGLKLGAKAAGKIAHVPPGDHTLEDAAEFAGRQYDMRYAMRHPEKVVSISPSPAPQELVDKNTLKVSDPNDLYGSVVKDSENGDPAFFEQVDNSTDAIDTAEDREFFEEQDADMELDEREDPSFFDKIDKKSDELGQKLDNAIAGEEDNADENTHEQDCDDSDGDEEEHGKSDTYGQTR